MDNYHDWNRRIIEEFRANGGKVRDFDGVTLLLLHTIGAKSGQEQINPLVYAMDGDRIVIIASKAGAPTNPDWYYNLLHTPVITVEVGTEQFQARASMVEGEERERLYDRLAALMPTFDEYRQKTTRQMPVVVLERLP